ncbi:hypothetical protein MTR67_025540 [Solanum verrucosum]|uniref:Reverse transcriptase/retrotransposon-derived protein RNase H-like domain-containing protein n=1 Tax=Solanum verrucosum TaxID=315347 RepID=A0AAF0TYV2_SOLVR|nr:hypothetical protein MTR67_025540 [Solanum verrucosum]
MLYTLRDLYVKFSNYKFFLEYVAFLGNLGSKDGIMGFSAIAIPLTRLNRFNVPFEWFEECDLTFQNLEAFLTTAPILTLLVEGERFTVYCDTSDVGLGVRLVDSIKGGMTTQNGFESSFVSDVKDKQGLHPILVELKETMLKKPAEAFSQRGDSVLLYQGRLCISNVNDLRDQILSEAHSSRYSIHPGVTKMHHDLQEVCR